MSDCITSGELVLTSTSPSPLPGPGRLRNRSVVLGFSVFNHTSCDCCPRREFTRHGEAVSHSSQKGQRGISSRLLFFNSSLLSKTLVISSGKKSVSRARKIPGMPLTSQEASEATGCGGDWVIASGIWEGLQSNERITKTKQKMVENSARGLTEG